MEALTQKEWYRLLWRWHFYAGIFAIPFVLILSVTGALYLFKPQFDAWQDASYRGLTIKGDLATPSQQLAAAMAAVPQAQWVGYELPRDSTDAVAIYLRHQQDKWRVMVHPQSLQILSVDNEDRRFMRIVHELHGELLLGKVGSVLVELAASWAIVLVLTGIYLWWPRHAKGFGGLVYPRWSLTGRLFWRDLHSVVGLWIAFFVLFLLLSGLPWAFVWGSALKEVREFTGTAAVKPDWVIAGRASTPDSGEHAGHQHSNESSAEGTDTPAGVSLDVIVERARQLHFAPPVVVSPPSKTAQHWSVKSNAQNRPLRSDAFFDARTGDLLSQQAFAERHLIDRVVGIGVAAHEGQLFGWMNQLLGLLTAVGLVAISISGFVMWRQRAPQGALGAPPTVPDARLGKGFVAIILVAALLLPLLGLSLLVLFVLEILVLSRIESARRWLGLV